MATRGTINFLSTSSDQMQTPSIPTPLIYKGIEKQTGDQILLSNMKYIILSPTPFPCLQILPSSGTSPHTISSEAEIYAASTEPQWHSGSREKRV